MRTKVCGRHLPASASALAIVMVPGASAWAAEAPAPDAEPMEEIVVVATRTPQVAFDLPQMVGVIDRERIADRLPQQLDELFEGMPNVRIDTGARRNGDQPNIRGIGAAGVLILVDGARQSFLSGHDGRLFLDPELIARIEVQRGPASALYGSGALGGVISIETLSVEDLAEGDRAWGASTKGAFQSVNDEWFAQALGYGRAGDLALTGAVAYRSGSDIRLGDSSRLQADDEILSSHAKASWGWREGIVSALSFTGTDIWSREPNNAQGVNAAGPANPLVDRRITARSITLRQKIAPVAHARLLDLDITGFVATTRNREDEVDSDRLTFRDLDSLGLRIENHMLLLGEDESGRLLRLVLGGEIYGDEQDGFDSTTPDNRLSGVPRARTVFAGLFAQLEAEVATPLGRVLFIPGLRWDRFRNRRAGEAAPAEDAVSPKLGLSWFPHERFMVFANWAESFRAPNMNEVFNEGIHFRIPLGPFLEAPNFFVPNPDLKPESGRTIEAGAGYAGPLGLVSGDRLSVKSGYFHSEIDDLIDLEVTVAFTPGCFVPGLGVCSSGTSRFVNRADARLEGVELELAYETERLELRASYATLRGRDRATARFLGSLLPDTFYADAALLWPGLDLKTGVRIEIADAMRRVNDPDEARKGFEKVDIYVRWEPQAGPLRGLRLDVGIDNVGDETFSRIAAGAPAPGRNVKVALGFRF